MARTPTTPSVDSIRIVITQPAADLPAKAHARFAMNECMHKRKHDANDSTRYEG